MATQMILKELIHKETTLSIVSHGQASLVRNLLKDIDSSGAGEHLKEVVITSNLPELEIYKLASAPLKLIVNKSSKGFGENHNAAFMQCTSAFFLRGKP